MIDKNIKYIDIWSCASLSESNGTEFCKTILTIERCKPIEEDLTNEILDYLMRRFKYDNRA